MIRFLDLSNQIEDGVKHFAFYDTVRGDIIIIYDTRVFQSMEDFEICTDAGNVTVEYYKRLKALIPENFFEENDRHLIGKYFVFTKSTANPKTKVQLLAIDMYNNYFVKNKLGQFIEYSKEDFKRAFELEHLLTKEDFNDIANGRD